MALTLSNLKPAKGSNKRKRRIGRGNASGRGTYSGRGLKGQRSRSGGKGGLKVMGMKARLQKVPKLRGFKSPHPKAEVVNLADLEKYFADGGQVTIKSLKKLGLVDKALNGVKILGPGKVTKKLNIKGCKISQSVKEQIEKAGGKVL